MYGKAFSLIFLGTGRRENATATGVTVNGYARNLVPLSVFA
jgi:hypothetical protein